MCWSSGRCMFSGRFYILCQSPLSAPFPNLLIGFLRHPPRNSRRNRRRFSCRPFFCRLYFCTGVFRWGFLPFPRTHIICNPVRFFLCLQCRHFCQFFRHLSCRIPHLRYPITFFHLNLFQCSPSFPLLPVPTVPPLRSFFPSPCGSIHFPYRSFSHSYRSIPLPCFLCLSNFGIYLSISGTAALTNG